MKPSYFFDVEYRPSETGFPTIVCCCFLDVVTQSSYSFWVYNDESALEDLKQFFRESSGATLIGHSVEGDLISLKAAGIALDNPIIDTWVETKNLFNGRSDAFALEQFKNYGLIDCLEFFSLPHRPKQQKEDMRKLILDNESYSEQQKTLILRYCEQDCVDVKDLYLKISKESLFDTNFALYRGRSTLCMTDQTLAGMPLDADLYAQFKKNWPEILRSLQKKLRDQSVFGSDGALSNQRLLEALVRGGVQVIKTPSGKLKIDKESIDFYKLQTTEFNELFYYLDLKRRVRFGDLNLGTNGRNHFRQRPFGTTTSRNIYSKDSVLNLPEALRSCLITPPKDRAIIQCDYKSQEIGVAACISNDEAMIEAYNKEDFYLEFAKMAGAVPPHATKKTHPIERSSFKICALAVLYGGGCELIAKQARISLDRARELVSAHKKIFNEFWRYQEKSYLTFKDRGYISSRLKWYIHASPYTKSGTILNFPMQANSAEIMRVVGIRSKEKGYPLVGSLHDGFFFEVPEKDIESSKHIFQKILRDSSAEVLGGFPLKVDIKIIKHKEYFEPEDEEKRVLKKLILDLLRKLHIEAQQAP